MKQLWGKLPGAQRSFPQFLYNIALLTKKSVTMIPDQWQKHTCFLIYC